MAKDLYSEVKMDLAGQAVTGFRDVVGDGDVPSGFHFIDIDEVATDDPQSHHLDPLATLIAAEESNEASIKAFADYAQLKEMLADHDPFVAKAQLKFLVKHGKLKQEGIYVPTGGVK